MSFVQENVASSYVHSITLFTLYCGIKDTEKLFNSFVFILKTETEVIKYNITPILYIDVATIWKSSEGSDHTPSWAIVYRIYLADLLQK